MGSASHLPLPTMWSFPQLAVAFTRLLLGWAVRREEKVIQVLDGKAGKARISPVLRMFGVSTFCRMIHQPTELSTCNHMQICVQHHLQQLTQVSYPFLWARLQEVRTLLRPACATWAVPWDIRHGLRRTKTRWLHQRLVQWQLHVIVQ